MFKPSTTLVAQVTAEAIYKKWISGLTEIKGITDPRIRKWWTDDLHELHDLAQSLLDEGLVTGLPANQLTLIVSRPVDQHLSLR